MDIQHIYNTAGTFTPTVKVYRGDNYVPSQIVELSPITLEASDIPGFEEGFETGASTRWTRTNTNGTVTFNDGTVYMAITSTDNIPRIRRNETFYIQNNRIYMEARWKIGGNASAGEKAVNLLVRNITNSHQACMAFGRDNYLDSLSGLQLDQGWWHPPVSDPARTGSIVVDTYVVCKAWLDGNTGTHVVQLNDGPIVSKAKPQWINDFNGECEAMLENFGWYYVHTANIDYIKVNTW